MPSVVVLHDLVIQEMLLDSVANDRLDRDVYLDAIAASYGAAARETAVDALKGRPGARTAMLAHSGADLAMAGALATVTHAADIAPFLGGASADEIVRLNLPYPCAEAVSGRRLRSGPLRLLQFGHIGPNRRLPQILDALGALRSRLDFRFDIAGEIWDLRLIRDKIAELGLEDRVTLRGFLPETTLDSLIAEAHLVFNLRYPTMGEASGSQLRLWSRAACSVVSDIGWYAALPEDTVLRLPVDPDAEAEGLTRLLLEIEADRLRFAEIGRRGLEHLRAHHDPDAYAEEICGIVDRAAELSRDHLMRQSATRHPRPLERHAAARGVAG
jgi:glycosyltransferase involved in cell wall biosynthesis